ncbi:chemotaxis protein CheA, partial [Klebsiella pneumoniae]|nr:chemotaxis protein CheA [Klebsiella pneumoniae]
QQPTTPAVTPAPAPAPASTAQETEPSLVVTLRNVGAREQTTLRDELTNMGEVTDVEATTDSMTVTLRTTASADDITA